MQDRAIEFERLNKSRTYILCDEDSLNDNKFEMLGYFALSLKVLIVPDNMSIRARKELDGYRGKLHGKPIREIPCFLIGQLAKNSNVLETAITGEQLLSSAIAVIKSVQEQIGGRYVMIECRNIDKLIKFYNDNGFWEFDFDEETGMVQMLMLLD